MVNTIRENDFLKKKNQENTMFQSFILTAPLKSIAPHFGWWKKNDLLMYKMFA